MSSILEKEFSILERLPSSRRIREHDNAGAQHKKTKTKKRLTYQDHFDAFYDNGSSSR